MAQELFADDFAYLTSTNHLMDLTERCPLNTVGLSGLQYHLYFGRIPVQAIVVIVGASLGTGIQQLEFLGSGYYARLLLQFPDNRGQTVLPCFDSTSGILPGAGG